MSPECSSTGAVRLTPPRSGRFHWLHGLHRYRDHLLGNKAIRRCAKRRVEAFVERCAEQDEHEARWRWMAGDGQAFGQGAAGQDDAMVAADTPAAKETRAAPERMRSTRGD